jgi:uncharacterized C2H2 Zn-finger protein
MKVLLMENNPLFPTRSSLPKAPPVPEEPTDRLPRGELVCEICGKIFKTHSQLDRHMESMHGHPEKTHLQPHTGHLK